MSKKYRHECPEGCKVFVGNLDRHMNQERIRHIFGDFGRIRDIWLATNPPGFGFVMYEHRSAARQAVKAMNNQSFCGRSITVELATGIKRHSSDGDGFDHRSDRRVARDDGHRHRHRSSSGDRRARKRSGDRPPEYQRSDSPLTRRRRRSDSEERSRERRDVRPLRDEKSRSRRRLTSDQ